VLNLGVKEKQIHKLLIRTECFNPFVDVVLPTRVIDTNGEAAKIQL
jgi:hypothetical protein